MERSEQEIEDTLDKAAGQVAKGGSKYPGMTYEEGVAQTLYWVTGQADENPMDDE
jgi:predicted secreted Zn-dependent protease